MSNPFKESFENAQQAAIKNPTTFKVPDLDELKKAVQIDDMIKVCHTSERFWVQVLDIKDSKILGAVANVLIYSPLQLDEEVIIEYENIYQHMVYDDDDDEVFVNTEEDNIQFVHVTCGVLKNDYN